MPDTQTLSAQMCPSAFTLGHMCADKYLRPSVKALLITSIRERLHSRHSISSFWNTTSQYPVARTASCCWHPSACLATPSQRLRAQPAHGSARLYVSQPLLSDECPSICSIGSLTLAGCALYGNNTVWTWHSVVYILDYI